MPPIKEGLGYESRVIDRVVCVTATMSGDTEYGNSSQSYFQLGCLTDIKVVAINEDNSISELFEGTVRTSSKPFSASGGDKTAKIGFQFSATGHGNLKAKAL